MLTTTKRSTHSFRIRDDYYHDLKVASSKQDLTVAKFLEQILEKYFQEANHE